MITGRMGNYLKSLSLQAKWQEKKNEDYSKPKLKIETKSASKQKEDSYDSIQALIKEIRESCLKARSLQGSSECSRASVESKLQWGGKFSSQELEYARTNCPDLYAKVLAREKERQEYARQLRNCQTKDQVFQVQMGKMASFMSDIQSAVSTGNLSASFEIRARVYEADEEYINFVDSDQYQKLKWERDIRDEEDSQKKAEEAEKTEIVQQENETQAESIESSAEEEIPGNGSDDKLVQEQPENNPGVAAANNKSKPATGKHIRHQHKEKHPEVSVESDRIKFAVNKYKMDNAEVTGKKSEVKSDVPSVPEGGFREAPNRVSISI